MLGELIFNIILLAFFCLMFVLSLQIEIWNGYVGARYWPMVLIVIAIILFIVKIFKIWKAMPEEEKKKSVGMVFSFESKEFQRLLAAFALCLIYVLLLPTGGFLLTTFLFAAAFSKVLGADRFWKMALAGLFSSVPIFMVFVWGLDIHLPRGTGALYSISVWLEQLVR